MPCEYTGNLLYIHSVSTLKNKNERGYYNENDYQNY